MRIAQKCIYLPGAVSSCTDGVRSASEEGVDCGGVCEMSCGAAAAFPMLKVVVASGLGLFGAGMIAGGVLLTRYIRRRNAKPGLKTAPETRKKKSTTVAPTSVDKRAGGGGDHGKSTKRHSANSTSSADARSDDDTAGTPAPGPTGSRDSVRTPQRAEAVAVAGALARSTPTAASPANRNAARDSTPKRVAAGSSRVRNETVPTVAPGRTRYSNTANVSSAL
jgi:hypothetical protein